jgi:hypothetical protein
MVWLWRRLLLWLWLWLLLLLLWLLLLLLLMWLLLLRLLLLLMLLLLLLPMWLLLLLLRYLGGVFCFGHNARNVDVAKRQKCRRRVCKVTRKNYKGNLGKRGTIQNSPNYTSES